MSLTAIPNVTSGGVAVPLGRNMFFMRGKKHKDGGIVIGDKRKGIEVEDGEVVKLDQHNTKVFSSMPLLNGNSPASLVLNGANPQQVFRAQERFKDNVGLKDDGTNKYKDGGEDEGYGWVDAAKDVAGFIPFVGTAVDAYDFVKDPSWENAGWLAASTLSDLVGARAAVKGARAAVKGARMLGRGARVGAVALGSAPRLAVDAVRATHPKQSIRIAARAARNLNGPALAFETSFNNNFVRNTLARGLAPQLANSGSLLRTGANLVGSGILTMMNPFDTAVQLLQAGRDVQKANSQNNSTTTKQPKKYAAGGKGHISNRGVNLIGTFEGFMPRIYKDSGGVETIGYGETDRDFINRYRGRQISRAEATQQLRNRAQWFYDQVANKTVGWDKLNQDQRDVLTSYAYNIGVGGYQRHKRLLAAIAAGDYNLAAKNINAGMNDARNPGLRKRRLKEQFIFTNGYGGDLFNSYNKIHTNGDTKGFVKPTPVAPAAVNLNEGFMTNVVPKPDPMLKDFEDLERLRYMGSRLPQFKAGGKIKHEDKMLLPGNLGGNQYDVRYKDRDITYTTFAGDIRKSYNVPAGKTLREVLLADRKRMDDEAKAKRDAEQRAYDKKSWWGKTGHNIAKGAESVGNFLLPESDNTRINITKQGTIVGHRGNAAYDPIAEAVVGGKIAGPVFKYAGKLAGKALKPIGRYVAKATPVIGRAAKSVGNAVSRRVSNLVKRIPKPLSEPNSLLNRAKTAAKNVATRVSNAVENKLSSAKSAVSDFWHNTANKVSNFFTGKDRYVPARNAGAAGNGFIRVKPIPKPNPPVAARQATQRVAQQSARSQARQAAAHSANNYFIPGSERVTTISSLMRNLTPVVTRRQTPARFSQFLTRAEQVIQDRARVRAEAEAAAAARNAARRTARTTAVNATESSTTNAAANATRSSVANAATNTATNTAENAVVNTATNATTNAAENAASNAVASSENNGFVRRSMDYLRNRRHTSKAAKQTTKEFIDAANEAKKKGLTQPAKPTLESVKESVAKYNTAHGTNVNPERVFARIEKPVGRAYDYIANPTVKGWAKNVWGNHKGKILTGGAALAYLGYNVLANNSNPDTSSHDAVLVKPSTNNGPAVVNTPPDNQQVAPTDSTQTPNVTIQAPEDTPQNNNVPNVVVENPNTQNNTESNTVGNSNSSETVTPTNTNTGNNKAATNTTPNTATVNTGSNTTPTNKQNNTNTNNNNNTNTKPVNNTQHSNNTVPTNNATPTNNNATNNTNTTTNTNTKPVITQKPNVNNQSVTPQQSINTPSVNNVSPNTNTTNTQTNSSKSNNNTNAAAQHEVNDGKPIYEVKSNKPQLNTDTSGDKANPKFIDRLFPHADNKQNANDANSNTHMPTTQGTNKGIAVGLDGKVRLINTSSDSPYVPINTTTTPIAQRKGKYVNGNPVFNEDKSGNYTFYKDKKGNLIPSKKFKFVDSEYVLNPNYYSQENRNDLGAASIANDINMQEQMKNAKYRDLDGKVIDANYKPTPVPLNPSKKSLWQKFKELDDGTKSDIVGIGSNVISGVSGYLNNLHMLNSLKAPVAPVLNQAAKLKTTVNINPQLDTVDRGVQSAVRDSNENTASSNVAASRNMAASLYGVASKNQLYGNKENAETELINKDKLNQQEVARANAEAYNNYTNNVINFRNTVADKRAENFNGLLNTLNSGVQDAITKREQRTNFRNSVKASLVSNPDSALLMANAFPKLLPTDFMNELQKRQREIEENRKKLLAAQVGTLNAQQDAYNRFRPVTQ